VRFRHSFIPLTMTNVNNPSVWLITGTSSGLGRCLVHSVLARGDRVIATARSLEHIEGLFPESDNIRLLQLDVDSGSQIIQAKVQEALSFWGVIDILVNNAGYGEKALIEEAGSERFKRQFQTNFFGVIDVTTAVLPSMRSRCAGTVVMIGSRTSWSPENPSTGLYAASKAALRSFSETLAAEVAQFTIRILIVEPGGFRTNSLTSNPIYTGHTIADYDDMRSSATAFYEIVNEKLRGDPAKAMELLVDVVKGEGKAAGRPWPLYLPLGSGADKSIRGKCTQMLSVMDKWKDVTIDLDFDDI